MATIDPVPDATVNIAHDKLNQPHRQKIWKWRCLACGKYGNRTMMLKNNQAATFHAEKYIGHNVVLIKWTTEGEVFDRVIVREAKDDYSGPPPF